MDFLKRLEAVAALVEQRLGELLPAADGADGTPRRLAEAMRYAALGGGKRLRPFLLIESARLFGVAPERAIDAAVALECLHCYSLAHDDLPAMDDDALRRGRPTLHVAFDEATAILAGDALLTFAFELLLQPSTHADPAVRADLALRLARAGGARGMAGGQQLDLDAEGVALDAEAIRRLQSMKTGALIAFACEAGAIIGGGAIAEQAALRRYGERLGQAFQLADDLLDAEGSEAEMGKATGKDRAAGKATLVAILGNKAARTLLTEFEGQAVAALAPFGAKAALLAEAAHYVASRRS
jgi:farnesyl diphosphate synthase